MPSFRERIASRNVSAALDVFRSPAFYILAFAAGSLWFCMDGVVQHQTIFMSSQLGITMNTLPLIVSTIYWFAIIIKLVIGYLSDHYDKVLIMFITVVALIAGLSILRFSTADHLLRLYCYAAVFGIGYGGTFTMIQLVIAEFYSGQSYGKILGILTMVDVGSGGIAITFIARIQGAFNSFRPVIEMLIGLSCLVIILVLFLYRMRRNLQRETAPQAAPIPAGK